MPFSIRPIHTTPWYGDHLRVSGALAVIYRKYFDDSPYDIPKSKERLERFLAEELGMSDQLAHHERTYIIDTLASELNITEESDPPDHNDPFSGWDSSSSDD